MRHLVIPFYIDDRKVTVLSENFIQSLKTVKNLYIANTVNEIQGEPDPTIIVHCYKDGRFYTDNSESEWNIQLLMDSDFVNFLLGDIPFDYNMAGQSVDVAWYKGTDDIIVIPSYINGYPVMTVSMDLLRGSDIVVIPDTVTSITGTSARLLYTPVFAIELIFTVLAVVLALLTVDVLLPRYAKSKDEYLLTGSQMVAVALYVIAQVGFGIYAIHSITLASYTALIVSVVILIMFFLLIFLGGVGRQHAVAVTDSMRARTSRMDAIKESAKYLANDIEDSEPKKTVQRLVDEIRYSDPVSREELAEMEDEIATKVKDLNIAIAKGDNDAICSYVKDCQDAVARRNEACKSGKR